MRTLTWMFQRARWLCVSHAPPRGLPTLHDMLCDRNIADTSVVRLRFAEAGMQAREQARASTPPRRAPHSSGTKPDKLDHTPSKDREKRSTPRRRRPVSACCGAKRSQSVHRGERETLHAAGDECQRTAGTPHASAAKEDGEAARHYIFNISDANTRSI